MKVCFWIAASFLLLVSCGILYQLIGASLEEKQYPPPGTLVDVGGYRLHLHSMGTGGPTVVLDAGLGGISAGWGSVQTEIAQFTRVVSYDRAGLGWSDKSPEPRTSRQIVQELHALLQKANIPGPYILVGHSLGGGNVQLFAATFPEEVAGLVLVDSCHEDQEKRLPASPLNLLTRAMRNPTLVQWASVLGIPRLFSGLYMKIIAPSMPEYLSDIHRAQCLKTKYCHAASSEAANLALSLSQLEMMDRSALADKPCTIITAELKPNLVVGHKEYWKEFHLVWGALQKELVSRFPLSKQIIAENSDHMIPWCQPELVVDAVKELSEQIRTHATR